MIPPHLVHDMIRKANLALWSSKDHRQRAESFVLALGECIRLFGAKRFRLASGVDPYRLRFHRPARKQIQPMLLTVLRILPALGLRLRVEADPDPRHLMRPITSRVLYEEKLEALEEADPTGELARQSVAKEKRRRARSRIRDQAYSKKYREEHQ